MEDWTNGLKLNPQRSNKDIELLQFLNELLFEWVTFKQNGSFGRVIFNGNEKIQSESTSATFLLNNL